MTATEADQSRKAPAEAAQDGRQEPTGQADSADTAEAPQGRGLPQLSKAIGVLFGSTTVLSAIMFYFGWSRAYYFYDYFGVESSLLGLTTRDYLQLSVDGLFVPLAFVACAALAVLWGWSQLASWAVGQGWSAVAVRAVPIAGAVLLLNGLSGIVVATPLNTPLAVAPLCLGAGAVLVISGLRRHRAVHGAATPDAAAIAEWAVVFVFVALSLFWLANDYSAAVGRSRAQQLVRELPGFPHTTIYSEKSLGLTISGIREIRCADPNGAYGFRYDGLNLILQSSDQYLLLPTDWSRADGVAVLLPRTTSLRLEFAPADSSAELPATC